MSTEPIDPLRRRSLGGLLSIPAWSAIGSLGVLAAGCAAPAASVPAPTGAEPLPTPALRIGDRWRYVMINRYNGSAVGETVVEVVAVSPEIRLRVDPGGGAAPTEERYADPWSVLTDATYDSVVTFETPVPVVPPGARTGLTLSTGARYRSERSNDVLAWNQQLRVSGWERVQVPAGAFDALRIERMIRFKHPDVFRFDPVRTDVLWYAPAVGRWVMREWTGNYMSGGPQPMRSRSREDWVQWQLKAWEPAGR
jgi:hypothetical protein